MQKKVAAVKDWQWMAGEGIFGITVEKGKGDGILVQRKTGNMPAFWDRGGGNWIAVGGKDWRKTQSGEGGGKRGRPGGQGFWKRFDWRWVGGMVLRPMCRGGEKSWKGRGVSPYR